MNRPLQQTYRTWLWLLAFLWAHSAALAQVPTSITAGNQPYSQDFNTLALTGTSTVVPTGWSFVESSTNANNIYTAGTGSSNTGDTYSFGAASNTDRAFGGLRSGGLIPIIGAAFTNNTGSTVTSFSVTYTGEQWRLGATGRNDRLDFQYSLDATSLTTGTWTDVNALDFIAPISVGTTGALDGNNAANRLLVSHNIASGISIPNGATIYIRFTDFDASGADDGLGVDDLTVMAGIQVTPVAMLSATPNTLGNFTTLEGTASASQSYVLAGNNLGGPIAVSAPAGFAVSTSTDANSFGPTTNVPAEGGTVYVRLTGAPLGAVNGTITNISGSLTANVAVSGQVNTATPPVTGSGVVISQIYGGGGNTGATYKNDFIELYNRSASPVNLAGWSVQYAGAGGTSGWQVTPLSGTIAPGGYYLIQQAAGAGGTVELPTPDAVGTIAMGATAGKVALVNSTGALSGSCPTGVSIIDFVGFGSTASCFEGTAPATAPSNTLAVLRAGNGATDSDNNSADFATAAPNPRSSSPSLTATPNSLTGVNGLSYTEGGGPATTTLSVRGANLNTASGDITVTSSDAAFTVSPTTIPFSNSALASTTLSVQLVAGLTPRTYTGTITLTGGGATLNVPVSATVNGTVAMNTLISTVQGTGASSPLAGQQVAIEGIVTRNFPGTGGLNGFYVQEEDSDSDNNPATSEGIFVLDQNVAFTGNVGDKVRLTGVVSEFFDLTQITLSGPANLTNLGASSVQPSVTSVVFPVSSVSVLEQYEGMLVTATAASGNLVVTNVFELGRFGRVQLAADGASNQAGTDARLDQYTQFNVPSVSGYAAYEAELAKRQISLDDANDTQNPAQVIFGRGGNPLSATNTLRTGDAISSITGILDYRRGAYRLETATPVNFEPTNPRLNTPPAVGGSLKVAGFNVLNYFTDLDNNQTITIPGGVSFEPRGANTAAEFTRQRDKIIAALSGINADVVGLIEIENNGAGAISNLVNGLNAASAPGTYAYIDDTNLINDPNAAPNAVGTDAIKVAFIYKPGSVTPVGLPMSSSNAVFDRPPVAQTFRQNNSGAKFTAIVNHFKSKGSGSGANADQNDGQGASNADRVAQANALLSFIPSVTAVAGDPDVLLLGDYNAYAMEDPIRALAAGGYNSLRPNSDYSYSFDGRFGFLDYAFANASLAAQVSGSADWHINSDEPIILDYNTEFKSPGQVASFYNADPFRASDHDAVIVGLSLVSPVTALSISLIADPTTLLTTGTTNLSATVSGGTAPYTYTFSGPGTITPSGNTATVSGLPAGVQTFTVVAADATSPTSQTISATVSVQVTQANRAPVASAIPNQIATTGQEFSLDIASSFTDPDGQTLTYTAAGLPGGLLLDGSSIKGTPTSPGTATVTITATDPGMLTASSSFTLTVNPAQISSLVATATPGTICPNGTANLSVSVSGGTAPYSYAWTGPGTITNASSAMATVTGLTTSGTYTFTVVVTDTYSQTATATAIITVNETPVVTVTPSATTVCAGQSAILTATEGSSYLWNTGETSQSISASTTGTYSVTVTSGTGCSASASAGVTVNQPVTAPALSSVTAIQGSDNVVLTAANCAGTLVWTGASSGSGSSITVSTATLGNFVYNVQCKVGECLSAPASVTVTIQAVPNTAPTVANPIPDQTGTVGQLFSYAIPANTFADDAGAAALTYTVAGLPAGLSFANGTISGRPTMSGTSSVTVTAKDAGNLMASTIFTLTVNAGPNQAPTTTGIANQIATEGKPYSLATASAFADPENKPLTYSASKLPKGLSLDASSGIISGTPDKTGVYVITLTATDPGKLSVSTNFTITVNEAINTAPVVVSPVANATINVKQPYSLNVASVFTDAETPAELDYDVSGLPKDLDYSKKTNMITGSPDKAGVFVVTLKATDPGKLSTSISYTLTVRASGARMAAESEESTLKLQLEVYPNPVVGSSVAVQIRNAADQTVQLRLIDLRGKVFHAQQIQVLTNQHTERVELANFPAGMFLIHISTGNQNQVKTILKE